MRFTKPKKRNIVVITTSHEQVNGGETMDLVFDILITGVISLIVLWDIKDGIIPNILLVMLLIIKIAKVGASIAVNTNDTSGTFMDVLGGIGCIVLMVLLLFPFFSVGALGAGDVKLIAVSALGLYKPMLFFLTVFVIALLMGVIKLLAAGSLKSRLGYLFGYLKGVLVSGMVSPYIAADPYKMSYSVHLSLPILAALLVNRFFLQAC